MKPIAIAGLKYFLYFCLLYGTLTAISFIPQIGASLNSMYRKPTAAIIKSVFQKAYIRLKPELEDASTIKVEYASRQKVQQQLRASSSYKAELKGRLYVFDFYKTFLSFYIFFVSLMLLSPLPRREKLTGLFIGSVLFYLFSVFKVAMALLFFFNDSVVDIYHASNFWVQVIRGINNFMTLGISLLVVLTLWGILAFRKENWRRLLDKEAI